MDNAHAWARYCESAYYRPPCTYPSIDRWMPCVHTFQLIGGKPVRYYKIELTDAHWHQQFTSNQKSLTVRDFHMRVFIGAGEVFELTGIRDDTHWVGGLPGTDTENYFAFVVRGDEDVFDQNKRTTREIRAWQAMQREHFGYTFEDHPQAMYA
jgi:predicted aminopeptidase